MDHTRRLRDQVAKLLRGNDAHMPFAEAVAGFPAAFINVRPRNVDYSFWHLIEHMRITQADILDYLTNAYYVAPEWPRQYWPPRAAEATAEDWDATVTAFTRDLETLIAMVTDEGADLFGTVPSNAEHTVLREALIVADHNAYHIGELAILRQVEDAWGRRHDA